MPAKQTQPIGGPPVLHESRSKKNAGSTSGPACHLACMEAVACGRGHCLRKPVQEAQESAYVVGTNESVKLPGPLLPSYVMPRKRGGPGQLQCVFGPGGKCQSAPHSKHSWACLERNGLPHRGQAWIPSVSNAIWQGKQRVVFGNSHSRNKSITQPHWTHLRPRTLLSSAVHL